jgi:TolB-like protein
MFLVSERLERRLTAILAADVADYSRLVGADEEGTLAQWKAHWRELIDPKIAEHRGRIVKTTGDGFLVEFASVIAAVRWAVEIQRAMIERNADVPQERIEFRMGINVGDIIIDGTDIWGDGVNVAARLEALAERGGICVSGRVQEDVHGRLDIAFEDTGEQQLKNIARPVRVYRLRLNGDAATSGPALPDKPSIAVLPFTNMSDDSEQEYFADGMADEIITALSRCNWLFVIARNSSFTYKGKPLDARQIGRELGVRYLLEGSVRRAGNRLRIIGQLIDSISGAHIWADRFEGDVNDVFDLQDRIIESVVGVIEPKLQLAEIEQMKRRPAANLSAYDLLLRAMQLEHEFTEESLTAALLYLKQAIAVDPYYAPAMALAALCYSYRSIQGWMQDTRAEVAEGLRLTSRAVELGYDDANVLWMSAWAIWRLALDTRRARGAKDFAQRAVTLNPNSASASGILGWMEVQEGNLGEGLELLRRAERLSPRDPRGWFIASAMASCYFQQSQFEEAVSWASKALAQNPRYTVAHRVLAASLAELGQEDEANEAIQEVLKIEPGLSLSSLRKRVIYRNERLWTKYAHALRLAGLPE